MSDLFSGHVWDKKDRVKGASVFDRKLLYGNEHDSASHLEDGEDRAAYGKAEKHKMHDFWRGNALKMLSETVRRSSGDPTLKKVPGKKGAEWPGDLGKHHSIAEEFIKLGILSLHQAKNAEVFAKINPGKLAEAQRKFALEAHYAAAAEATATAEAASSAAAAPAFTASAKFEGARAGMVFKKGEQGVGYYRDGPAAGSGGGADGASVPSLPEGWVAGLSPEGYTYYWHSATSTSSWEFPTGEPQSTEAVPLAPAVSATFAGDGGAALRKIEDGSGAKVHMDSAACLARVMGSARQVARAKQLIERKAGDIAWLATQQQQQQPAAGQKRPASTGAAAKSNYDFSGHAGFAQVVQEATPEARAALRQKTEGGGALAALAAYGDDSDEED